MNQITAFFDPARFCGRPKKCGNLASEDLSPIVMSISEATTSKRKKDGSDAAEAFEEWRATRVRVGTTDLRIAAIARTNMLTILTRNRRDFERIPDVNVEDWTTATNR